MSLICPGWRLLDISQAAATDNESVDWHARFPAVTCRRLRVQVTTTQVDVSRIWEIEVYQVKAR